MPTPTLSFEELKNRLSAEKLKPKDQRDKNLIASLHSQINDHKKELQRGFKKIMMQKRKQDVADRLKLEQKKNLLHKKLCDKKLKAKMKEQEKLVEKSQPKKKEKTK